MEVEPYSNHFSVFGNFNEVPDYRPINIRWAVECEAKNLIHVMISQKVVQC